MNNTTEALKKEDVSKEKYYLFGHNPNGGEKITHCDFGKPTLIRDEYVSFTVPYNHGFIDPDVPYENIIGIGDLSGDIEVLGCGGKFRILNQELFDKLKNEKVLELKGKRN